MEFSTLFKEMLCSALVVISMAAAPALAHPLTLDALIDAADLSNSGDAATLAALGKAAGVDLDGEAATRVEQGRDVLAMRDPENINHWFINVEGAEPDYFVLKFGVPNGAHTRNNTFFFANIGELDKLVFSNAQVGFLSGGDCSKKNDNQCNIGRLSHYTFVGTAGDEEEPGSPVPEPTGVALLGAGLLGLLLGQRRRRG